MKNTTSFLMVVVCLFGSMLLAKAQTKSGLTPPIEITYKNDFPDQIHFRSSSGELKNTLNLSSLNPYSQLGWPLRTMDEPSGMIHYDLSKMGIQERSKLTPYLRYYFDNDWSVYELPAASAYASVSVSDHSDKFIAVVFSLGFGGGHGTLMKAQFTTIHIYDEHGQLYKDLGEWNKSIGEVVVSGNGRYMACKAWPPAGHPDYDTNDLFEVYDLELEQLIHQVDEAYMYIPVRKGNFIMLSSGYADTYHITVLDDRTGKLYEDTFKVDELQYHRSYSEEGMIFEDPATEGRTRVHSFLHDFQEISKH